MQAMPQPEKEQKEIQAPDRLSSVVSMVKKAKAGNRTALGRLVELFQEDIFRMIYYRTHSQIDAEDLTQEVFVQVFKSLSRIREEERFRAWIFSIALNLVRDFQRKKKIRALLGVPSQRDDMAPGKGKTGHHPEAMESLMRKEFWKQIKILLDKLSRGEKEVFLLRFMDHLSIREISYVLEKNESTVKTHLYRALGKLRKEPLILELAEEENR
jgi:RNA polymerase sigma-70 factor (ECF subfamily)